MYLGDVGQLESHLNNDWTTIFKNIKLMEDSHFELLQYNKRLTTKQRSQQDDPFINDQISQHQQEIARVTAALQAMQPEEDQIRIKYQASIVSFEEILKLMGRVGARLLETYQSSIDKCKSLDEDLLDKHLKMRASLIKILNQKDKINLQEIINLVITYSKSKLLNEVQRLRKIVQALQNGDYQRAQGQYYFKNQKSSVSPEKKPAPPSVSAEKMKISTQKAKVSSVGREQRSPVWQQLKAQERLRRQKQKVALRLVHGLYSTMDLARQQIIEDMCSNQREKAKRLYNEIFSRNKFNHDQIMAFEAKKDEFHQKIILFKQMMERESKKIAESLRKSSGKRERRKQDNLNFSKMEVEPSEEEEKPAEQELAESRKSNRYRIQSPKSKGKTNQYPMIIQCSQENFDHIKFQSANQNQSTYIRPNRNKLPFLYSQNVSQCIGRASSFDQRVQAKTKLLRNEISEKKAEGEDIMNHEALIRNEKKEKYLSQRAKVPLKNIEVRVGGVMRQEEQGKDYRNMKPNPMEYTFYVRRSNRFYEPNHNIIL